MRLHRVLEALSSVDKIERVVAEGVLGESAAARRQRGPDVGEHGKGKIEGNHAGAGVLILEYSSKTAFATTGIECNLVVHVSEVAGD